MKWIHFAFVIGAVICVGVHHALPQDSKSSSAFFYLGLGFIVLMAVGSLL